MNQPVIGLVQVSGQQLEHGIIGQKSSRARRIMAKIVVAALGAVVLVPYRGALYCLFKDSYSLADLSYICVVRPVGDNELKVVFRVDLGIGVDAMAMTIHHNDLFVFTGGKINLRPDIASVR